MNKTDLKLYAITDRQWLHGASLSEHVKLAIEGGATMIQIRDKDILSTDSDAGLKDEYNEALEIRESVMSTGCRSSSMITCSLQLI